ncbi:hypothetical protein QZH41_012277 [Actinostola sp. cb2023]|nr:hypothetical protein QZH41_012277 [Actinostola sp. cb2023]
MADEAMMALPVGKGKLEYTPKAYLQYLEQIRSKCLSKLHKMDPKGGWNEHKVELTLWTFVTASKLSPDLLSTLPKHKGKESDLVDQKPSKKMKKS